MTLAVLVVITIEEHRSCTDRDAKIDCVKSPTIFLGRVSAARMAKSGECQPG